MNALIIGGGVIGGAIAWELLQQGIGCTIVEKGKLFDEASTASAGMLCPQAEMLDASLPLELLVKSQELHREWTKSLEDVSGIPVDYINRGMMRVFTSSEEASAAQESVRLSQHGIKWLSAKDVLEMENDITPDNYGGMFFPHDASLHPIGLARSLERALMREGCVIKERTPTLSLIVEGGECVGVHTTDGDLYADIVIVAAGAWTSALLNPLGVHVPVHPVKGQLYAVRQSELTLERTVQGPGGMIIPRLDGTFTVGVTHLYAGYDKRPTVEGIAEIYRGVVQFIPKLKDASFVTTWAGLRPGTPDGLPYIGAIDGYENLWVAAGHYTTGIFLSRITAVLIAQSVLGQTPIVDLTRFAPNRFHQSVQSS